jgi:hypothetical protein
MGCYHDLCPACEKPTCRRVSESYHPPTPQVNANEDQLLIAITISPWGSTSGNTSAPVASYSRITTPTMIRHTSRTALHSTNRPSIIASAAPKAHNIRVNCPCIKRIHRRQIHLPGTYSSTDQPRHRRRMTHRCMSTENRTTPSWTVNGVVPSATAAPTSASGKITTLRNIHGPMKLYRVSKKPRGMVSFPGV